MPAACIPGTLLPQDYSGDSVRVNDAVAMRDSGAAVTASQAANHRTDLAVWHDWHESVIMISKSATGGDHGYITARDSRTSGAWIRITWRNRVVRFRMIPMNSEPPC